MLLTKYSKQWQRRIGLVSDSQLCVAHTEVTVPTQSSSYKVLLEIMKIIERSVIFHDVSVWPKPYIEVDRGYRMHS